MSRLPMKLYFYVMVLGVLVGVVPTLRAQAPVPPAAVNYQPMAADQLDKLLGPIALYPDPLIAQILPAATLPTQIVLADRYVSGGGDPNGIAQQGWDSSIQALARYPNVLKWMDDNLTWTTQLGEAFLYQQQEVMDAIQRLRTSAANLGNLQSTPQQQVVDDGGYYEIVPANPDVIYVPSYQPDQVYYQAYGGTPFINFGFGFAIGGWLDGDFDWRNHDLHRWDQGHPRPVNWWHEPPGQRNWGRAPVWHPENRPYAVQVNRGDRGYSPADRGYNHPEQRPVAVTVGHPGFDSTMPRREPMPSARPEAPAYHAAPVQHEAPVYREAPPRSPFVGIQSAPETRASSDRGHQSMQGGGHAAAPAPSHGGGGGGGGGGHPESTVHH
jgi:hypothetical protein